MTTILQDIKAVAADPVAAEKLCAKLNVEFHPIGCDIVTAVASDDKEALCQHVSAVQRKERQAKFDQRVKHDAAAKKAETKAVQADAKEAKVEADAKAEAKEAKAAAKEAKAAEAKAEVPVVPEASIAQPPTATVPPIADK